MIFLSSYEGWPGSTADVSRGRLLHLMGSDLSFESRNMAFLRKVQGQNAANDRKSSRS